MILGAFFFAAMGVCVKYAAAYFHAFEIVAGRGVVGLVAMWFLMSARGIAPGTRYGGMHAWRSAVGVVSLLCWFYAITKLPLAMAVTLNYMSSLWVAAFVVGSAMLFGSAGAVWGRQWPLLLAVLGGFAGVVALLQPSMDSSQFQGAVLGLLSSIAAALAYIQVTALGRVGEPEERVVFYFSLTSCVLGFALALGLGFSAWPGWRGAWWLLPVGVFATGGQLCMTRAYRLGSTLVVANLQYFGVVFASFFGLFLFDDALPWMGWLGIALIVGGGAMSTVLRHRALPQAPPDEH